MAHTLRFWEKLGIPSRHDHSAWVEMTRRCFDQLLDRHSSALHRSLRERQELLQDEFEELLTHLQMYLMRDTLTSVAEWIQSEIASWLSATRSTIQNLARLANERAGYLLSRLNDATGPVLKLSRSREEGFASEISSLAAQPLQIEVNYLRTYAAGDFEGLLAPRERHSDQAIFLDLKNRVQQALLNWLEKREPSMWFRKYNSKNR